MTGTTIRNAQLPASMHSSSTSILPTSAMLLRISISPQKTSAHAYQPINTGARKGPVSVFRPTQLRRWRRRGGNSSALGLRRASRHLLMMTRSRRHLARSQDQGLFDRRCDGGAVPRQKGVRADPRSLEVQEEHRPAGCAGGWEILRRTPTGVRLNGIPRSISYRDRAVPPIVWIRGFCTGLPADRGRGLCPS